MTRLNTRAARLAASAAALVVLAGCASFSVDGGIGSVQAVTKEHLGRDVRWARNDNERRRDGSRRR